MMGAVAEEQDELEQAWEALADRERLLNQTVARRSAEIDARARRYEEIGADLDARRQLIEESEAHLAERERRLALAEEELRDRQLEAERAAAEIDRLRERARERAAGALLRARGTRRLDRDRERRTRGAGAARGGTRSAGGRVRGTRGGDDRAGAHAGPRYASSMRARRSSRGVWPTSTPSGDGSKLRRRHWH